VTVFAFAGSYVLYRVTDRFIPLRVTPEQEEIGLDISQHGEVMDEAAAKALFAL
jgi:Amt family ammonium transporter